MKNFEGVTRRECDTATFLEMKEQAIMASDLKKENDFMREQIGFCAHAVRQPNMVNPQARLNMADKLDAIATAKAE